MKTWKQYCQIIPIEKKETGKNILNELNKILLELGNNGWELVSVQCLNSNTEGIYLRFLICVKR